MEETKKQEVDEQLFRHTLDNIIEGVQIHDFEWRYIYVNNALLRYSQLPKEQLLGHTIMENYPGIENTSLFATLQKCMTQRVSEYLQTEFVFPDGRKTLFELSIQPVPQGLFILSIDITERKLAEESLRLAEANYHEIFENATDAIYVHELPSGRMIDVNSKVSELTGYTKEEHLSLPPQAFVSDHPDYSLEKAVGHMLKASQGHPQLFEWLSRCKDGNTIWFEVNMKKIDLAGESRIVAFCRDISDRKKNEAKIRKLNEELEFKVAERTAQLENHIMRLKESEDKFQKAFEASAAGIALTRLSDSRYLEVNDAFANLVGYTKQELQGHTSSELGLVVNVRKREEVLQHIKEHGSAQHFEITVRHKSGKLLEVLSSAETIVLNGERFAINIIFDITERKHAEEQLYTVNKELEAFTYSISHDLRAPLRAAGGYAQILMDEYGAHLDLEGKRIIEVIRANTVKMGVLIDDLLEFSRLGRKEIRKGWVNLNKLVESVKVELERSCDHQAVFKMDVLPVVNADYNLLYQVMFNLLSNAVKYSSKKENPIVEVSGEVGENEVIIHVKDNGVGFNMQYGNKLFGVFQRLHTKEEFEGTGVGLAIVQRIVAKHGGKVWAESQLGEGASFYFSLPKDQKVEV